MLRGADNPRLNRVFTIEFPDRAAKEAFFADARYGAVRARFFVPAVAATLVLAELERAATPEGAHLERVPGERHG